MFQTGISAIAEMQGNTLFHSRVLVRKEMTRTTASAKVKFELLISYSSSCHRLGYIDA